LQEKKALPLTDLQLLLVAILWGSDFIFVKIALREISPLSFMAMRSLITTAAFLPFFLKQEKKWSVRPRDFWGLVAIAFLGSFINRVFFSLGLNLTSASNASLLITTAPLFVLLTSSFFSRKEITSRSVLGIAIAFAGAFFVIKRDWKGWTLITDYVEGDLYMIGAAFFWALFNVFARPFLKQYSSVKVMAYVMIFGTIFYLPFLPNAKGGNGWQVSALAWFCLFYGGLLGQMIGYFLWIRGIQNIGPLRAIIYQYATPVTAILLAVLFLGETMTAMQSLGAALVFGGIFLARTG
jgi:drug/metabolite transporter (DMT)-like permease